MGSGVADQLKAKAFTLTELLVIVGILSVLSAILFPVLVYARHRAKESSSLQQLNQIQVAMHLYASDSNDAVPFAVGNNCFHLAVDAGQECESVPAQLVSEMIPLNMSLGMYHVPMLTYRSPLDRMSPWLINGHDHKPTWFEETSTSTVSGSSFEYRTRFGIASRSLNSFASPAETILLFSLFTTGDDGPCSKHQIVSADGHVSTVVAGRFGDLLMREN